jgi:hypothetical protein
MSAVLTILLVLIASIAVSIALGIRKKTLRLKRADFIRTYRLPAGLFDKLSQRRPGLPLKDQQLVARGLRQFFLAHLESGCKFVSMPSQVVDDLWHEFILYTRHYDDFCKQAFGRFLHHTPAVVLSPDKQNNSGLRRTWWYACKEENINPRQPSRLPLLFALDSKLGIADGFYYSPDCKKLRQDNGSGSPYCGGDFSDSSFDGGTDGFGDSSSSDGGGDFGGAGADGGGCSGGGCGGGGD